MFLLDRRSGFAYKMMECQRQQQQNNSFFHHQTQNQFNPHLYSRNQPHLAFGAFPRASNPRTKPDQEVPFLLRNRISLKFAILLVSNMYELFSTLPGH